MTVRAVIGSAAVLLIQLLYLAYFSLLQAIATTTAMPAIEADSATIGHRGRTAPLPMASTSTAARSICTTTTVLMGSQFVASR